jgi:gamma-glutamylcyclotransferase (GGCT)/AIG2-like uncharacterized protein YtfP
MPAVWTVVPTPSMTMTSLLLFVYGTLRSGRSHHDLLRGQTCLGPARTLPRYRLYDCGRYPALVEQEPGVAVRGELWRIEADRVPELDAYEGAPLLFERRAVALDGVPGPVVAYFYNGDVATRRDCGDEWAP